MSCRGVSIRGMTRAQLLAGDDGTGAGAGYSVYLTRDPEDIRSAQRLRYHVFAGEMAARLHSSVPGHDEDHFDDFCDHLLVRTDDTGETVGTYRMLAPDRAPAAGGLYAEREFDLTALSGLRRTLVETGRSCVHPGHRTGAVIGLVWAGLARYMLRCGHRYLVGCASVPLADGGATAAGVWDVVRSRHRGPERYRVTPLRPWSAAGVVRPERSVIPPLLRGYLRLGATVVGPPAHDREFGVADFPVLLDMRRVDRRYLRFFLGQRDGEPVR